MADTTQLSGLFAKAAPQPFDPMTVIDRFYWEFPGMRSKVMFYDIRQKNFVGAERGPVLDEITAWINNDSLPQGADLREAIAIQIKKGNSVCLYLNPDLSVVLLDTGKPDLQCTIDHEAAHAMAPPDIRLDPNANECFADAYALIRHFQRNGVDAEVPVLLRHRASDFVISVSDFNGGGDRFHFTTPVLDAILRLRHSINWQDMTPDDVLMKAYEFTNQYKMNADALMNMTIPFASLGLRWNLDSLGAMKVLADFLCRTMSEDVFRCGLRAFRLISDEYAIGKSIDMTGEEWDQTRFFLKQKEKWFNNGGRGWLPGLRAWHG